MNRELIALDHSRMDQMTNTRLPRLHHYFPRFHLAYFAVRGVIWTYDKLGRLEPNPKPIPIPAVATEANLYDDNSAEEPLEGVEQWLASTVDGPASAVFRKVIAHQTITPTERADLGRYAMSRDLRTPRTRDNVMESARISVAGWYDNYMADTEEVKRALIESSGLEFTDDEIKAFAVKHRPVVPKGFWLSFLTKHVNLALPRLLAKGWTLIHADEGCEFVTSDIGLLKHHGGFDKPVPYAMGWSLNAHGWLMPLTPKVMLAMAPGLKDHEKVAQRVFVEAFNRKIAEQANEFVFACNEVELKAALPE